jgi:hypothetical protein
VAGVDELGRLGDGEPDRALGRRDRAPQAARPAIDVQLEERVERRAREELLAAPVALRGSSGSRRRKAARVSTIVASWTAPVSSGTST